MREVEGGRRGWVDGEGKGASTVQGGRGMLKRVCLRASERVGPLPNGRCSLQQTALVVKRVKPG